MRRQLSVDTMKHLNKWCVRQFPDDYADVFHMICNFLESVDVSEAEPYLNGSWWHAYDVAKGLGFRGVG